MRLEMSAQMEDNTYLEGLKTTMLQKCFSKMEVMIKKEVQMQLESPFAVDELVSTMKYEVISQMKELVKIEVGLQMKDQVAREVELQLLSKTGEPTQPPHHWSAKGQDEEMSPSLLEPSP